MKFLIEVDEETYKSLDMYVRDDSKGKGVIHNCLHAIMNGIPVDDTYTEESHDKALDALLDLKKEMEEIVTMKDSFIYHLIMDTIERKIREVEHIENGNDD